MYIEKLERQMAVCSFDGAARLVRLDKQYWSVVSIHGPLDRKAVLPLAKRVFYACFDDVEDSSSTIYRGPRRTDLAGIFAFIASLGDRPPLEPLLIHCQQGISRSAAVALSWIYRCLPSGERRAEEAVDILLALRPQAKPNRVVLAFGLAECMDQDKASSLARRMLSDPRLLRNRFEIPTFS